MENEIYVACWFDGNKAIMMAGTRNSEGRVTPLAVERRSGFGDAAANGVITLNEDNRNMIATLTRCIINRLTTTLNDTYTMRGLYLGVMPRSMRSVRTSGELILDTRRYVKDADIEECRRQAYTEASTFGDVLALYNNGFELDGTMARIAKDGIAKKIKMNALSVVVNHRFSTDYKSLMPKDVTLYGVNPVGVAVARTVTTPEERLNGVLSVHFCSKSTLFTAYRDDQVIATCVVPFGEDDVVHDMCQGHFKQDHWRKLYDNWDFVSGASNIMISDSTGKHPLDSETFEHMRYSAETRITEIYKIAIEWLCNQVHDLDALIQYVVFSGSLADKAGFINYVEESLLPEHKCQLRCGDIMNIMTDETYSGDADYIPLVGLIAMASESCVERKVTPKMDEINTVQEQEKQPVKQGSKGPSLFDKMGNAFKKLTEDDNL